RFQSKRLRRNGQDLKKIICDIRQIWDKGLQRQEYMRHSSSHHHHRIKPVAARKERTELCDGRYALRKFCIPTTET
ncbi:hypothetical protein ACYB49_30165, partial [Klebsiella pneumoniae]